MPSGQLAALVGILLVNIQTLLVHAAGICYDPAHTAGASAASITADMQLIKSHGFTHVRTYMSLMGSTALGPLIAGAGLQVSLGVPYPASDIEAQIAAAVSQAKQGNVVYIFVGNENLKSVSAVPSDMLGYIQSIKSQVPSSVKVGTVQRNTEILTSQMPGLAGLFAACDVIGINIHPFFTSGLDAAGGLHLLASEWTSALNLNSKYPGISGKLVLSETGWPSAGSFGGNTGSITGEQQYFSGYLTWSSIITDSNKYYFQMFDQPERTDGVYEQNFGLVTATGTDKFAGISSPTTAPPTPAPTPAPTPGSTPAPTPTVTPSTMSGSNSTNVYPITSATIAASGNSVAGSNENGEFRSITATGSNMNAAGPSINPLVSTSSSSKAHVAPSGPGGTNTNFQASGSSSSLAPGLLIAGCVFAVMGAVAFFARRKKMQLEAQIQLEKDSEVFARTPAGLDL